MPNSHDIQSVLQALVAINDLPGRCNDRIAACVRGYLEKFGVSHHVLPGPEGDRVNIFATIGPRDVPGVILSGHMDVVPTEGQIWSSDPFELVAREEGLYGRGTSDMKGFLACMIAMIPIFQSMPLRRPIHLAFSYDEEIGCRGAGHMIERLGELCAPPMGCIVGEPTGLQPVLAHKAKQSLALNIVGRAAHSSNPAEGVNAIYAAADILQEIRELAERLERAGPRDDRFSPPHSTIVAGVIHGGTAVNIIPDQCRIEMEVRGIPAQPPEQVSTEVLAMVEALLPSGKALSVSHEELARYPALSPTADTHFISLLEQLSGQPARASVSYGSEGGLFDKAGISTIICGPGSISRAHKPDEFIRPDELMACCTLLRGLAEEMAS